jgi:hypothetical protein
MKFDTFANSVKNSFFEKKRDDFNICILFLANIGLSDEILGVAASAVYK